MWKQAISGISLANIETLDYYQLLANPDRTAEEVNQHVITSINGLPFPYRIGLKLFAGSIGLLILLFGFRPLPKMKRPQRQNWLRKLQVLPLFGLLDKLVRTLSFIRLYDIPGNRD